MEKIILKLPLLLLALQIQSGKLMFPDNPLVLIIEAPTPEIVEFNNTIYATCKVTPIPNLPTGQPEIFGQVLFKQVFPNGTLEVIINLRGLPTDNHQVHAIHIHQFGDLSEGCVSTGPHYNPNRVDHPGHPGDLGNFVSKQGIILRFLKLPEGKLFGSQSILGRAVVFHEKEDDLGTGSDEESKRSGNAGKRIAGCVIGISSPSLWQIAVELLREVVEEDAASQR
ncbi:extracellular superoxide dismutase [Xyrauchen texanus]|uniref:extracellular superoxide dismutase n=1 Tax=Xyrauchen texanus TaxID=154827 RepID=UPI0022421288|nr:extracellular superoxide dismutase [Xyrauchen texanus]